MFLQKPAHECLEQSDSQSPKVKISFRGKWINKLSYIHTLEYYSNKKEWATDSLSNMDEHEMHFAKWKRAKPQKRHKA